MSGSGVRRRASWLAALASVVEKRPGPAFVVIAYAVSWAAWLPLLAAVQGWIALDPPQWLHLVGGLGPAVAALVVVAVTQGRSGLSDLGRRVVAWRGRGRAWLFVFVVPLGLLVVAAPLAAWLGGSSVLDLDWSAIGRSTEFAALPVGIWWIANFFFFGFGEEVGWRGFLQPHFEATHSVVTSAGLVSLAWAAWHLPLFGITPSYRAMPLVGLLGFAVSIWVASWIFAWLLHAGRGSLLVVVCFHAWFDIVTTSPMGPPGLPSLMGAGITIVGLVLLRTMLKHPITPNTYGVGAPVSRT
ncbi:CPBP family intramembrane glutamic endopeptidase [Cellulomonas sp.]|uniref:CPBP family intramembrane glutamic endopeptidase n=1 Tax=Cellulomonas sp. TaxID=40001 RepID=UPI003BA8DFF0